MGLAKRYRSSGAEPVVALDDVTFDAAPGEIVALVGPNGAGKTTLLKAIAGLVRPSAGSVTISCAGRTVERHEPQVALLPESSGSAYGRLSVRENLEFFGGLEGLRRSALRQRCVELIEWTGLVEKATIPAQLLSRGMRRRLSFACLLIKGAPVLLLDEPTPGLDSATTAHVEALLGTLAADGRTLIVCSHDLALVDHVASRVVILDRGKVVAIDAPARLRRLPSSLLYEVVVQALDDDDLDDISIEGVSARETRGRDLHLDVRLHDQRALWDVLGRLGRLPVRLISVRLVGYDLATAVDSVLHPDA